MLGKQHPPKVLSCDDEIVRLEPKTMEVLLDFFAVDTVQESDRL